MDPVQDQKNLNQNPEEAPPAPPSPDQPVLAPEPAPATSSPAAPPVISPPAQAGPPQPKKKLPISMFGIAAILLLIISIPVGVYLVRQTQELRGRAFEAADCDAGDRGGLKETKLECDANINKLVEVFICNNDEHLPGSPTGQECPQAPAPPSEPGPSLIPSANDGVGGCCTLGVGTGTSEGCTANEVCDISNGACQSGFSCRSIAGCTQDSNCGPGNECKDGKCEAVPPPPQQYTSCASWAYSDDSTNEADPNCEKAPQNGFSCRKPDGRAVCCYKDGNCFEGQQGGPSGQLNCENLGNGTIKLNVTTEVLEYHCMGQTSSTGSCSEGRTSLGQKGPGTYTVTGSCGGNQIDAVGYCGSYAFRGACQQGGPSGPILQCTAVKFYDTNWNLISNPQTQIRAGQTVRVAVVGSAQTRSAEFRVNGGAWESAVGRNASSELYMEKIVSAGDGGQFSVEARVY